MTNSRHQYCGLLNRHTSAFSVLIESEQGSNLLFSRVFFTRTGIHFARKRYRPTAKGQSLSSRELFPAWCVEGALYLAYIVAIQPMDFDDSARRIRTGAQRLLLDFVKERRKP